METQSSFIPKRKLTSTYETGSSKKKVNLFTIIAVVLFLISLVLAGGMFILQKYKVSAIEGKIDSLERAKGSFEPDLIKELAVLDARMKSAEAVINNHLATSKLFELLEKITLKSIRFTEFNFSSRDNGMFSLTMRGEADDYSSIALQSDIFGENRYIKESIFSDFEPSENGKISFNFSTLIKEDLIKYYNLGD